MLSRLVAKRVASCFLATTVLYRQLWAVPVVNPDGYAANCVIRSRWQRLIRLVPSVGLVRLLLSSVVLRDLPVPGAFAHMGFPSSPSTTLLSLPLSRHDVPASAVVLCLSLVPVSTPCCRGGGDFCSISFAAVAVTGRMCPAPRHRAPQTPRTTTGAWTSTGTTRRALSSRPTTTRPAGRSADR